MSTSYSLVFASQPYGPYLDATGQAGGGAAPVDDWSNAEIASIPPAQSNGSGFSKFSELPSQYKQVLSARVGIWNKAAGKVQPYQPGVNDQAIPAGTVPNYERGFGPDVGFAAAWLADSANNSKKLVFYKTDLTPPLSTNGSSIAVWNSDLKQPDFANHANFVAYMQSHGWGNGVSNYAFPDLGEADADANNANYQSDFTALIADFQAHGYFDANTKFNIPLLQRSSSQFSNDAGVNAGKQGFVNARPNAVTLSIPNPAFNPTDNTHYSGDSQLRRGQLWYMQRQAVASTNPYPIGASNAVYSGTIYDNQSGLMQTGANWVGAGSSGNYGTNKGLETGKYLAPNTPGRIRLTYATPDGRGAAMGWHTSAAKVSIFDMGYGIVIPSDPYQGQYYVSIYQAGTNPAPLPPPTAVLGYQYAIARDTNMVVSIQESANGNDWRILFQFAGTYNGPLYEVCDILGGRVLQVPQGTGLTATAGTGGNGTSTPADFPAYTGTMTTDGPAKFNTNPNVFVDGTGHYRTKDTSGTYGASTLMGTVPLPSNSDSLLSFGFDGTYGGGFIGFHNSQTPPSGFAATFAFYPEAKPGGGFLLRAFANGAPISGGVLDPAVSGTRYVAYRNGANGLVILSYDSAGGHVVFDTGINFPGTLYAFLSLLGDPNASLADVRQNW